MDLLKKLKAFVISVYFLKNIGLIILVHLLVIGGLILYLNTKTNHGEKISVPSLYGKNVNTIQGIVAASGLTYEVLDSIYAPDKPAGTIISQDPRPSDSTDVFVKEGRIIRVRVSKKSRLVEMPSLIDKSQRFAESVLKNRGLKYTITFESTREADGAVLGQKFRGRDIQDGTKIPIGSTISLVVGRNLAGEPIQIPDLKCLTINEARGRLSSMGSITLFESYIDCLTAADSASAQIISQNPEFIEGTLSPSGSTITILLDKKGCIQ
jgi:beta-lactam-binding protein with PASTA domain